MVWRKRVGVHSLQTFTSGSCVGVHVRKARLCECVCVCVRVQFQFFTQLLKESKHNTTQQTQQPCLASLNNTHMLTVGRLAVSVESHSFKL